MRFQEAWLELRARSHAVAMPTAIATIGMGHHQFSQSALKPWVLSRPDQNIPTSTRNSPTEYPTRRIPRVYEWAEISQGSPGPRLPAAPTGRLV